MISFSALSIFILYMICRPLSLYRGIVVGASFTVATGIVLAFNFFKGADNMLNINFDLITGEQWMIAAVIVVSLAVAVMFINTMYGLYIKYIRKEHKDEN